MYNNTIGLIGGFGGYATLDFYRRILDTFKGESEREFPHIIIDNDFTMPSRTRCLLTGENYWEIVEKIKKSISLLIKGGADYIILVCGTAHYFLEDIYRDIPIAKEKVLNIIDIVGEYYYAEHNEPIFVMAAEGALKKNLYRDKFSKKGIECIQPKENDYSEIRFFLESVKQNKITDETITRFMGLINRYNARNILLGCTELPVIVKSSEMKAYNKKCEIMNQYRFYDPLEYTLKRIHEVIK